MQLWKDGLIESMIAAGIEESAIARNIGHVDDNDVPYISVYVDGGWSKRSYGHSYNAASGAVSNIQKKSILT